MFCSCGKSGLASSAPRPVLESTKWLLPLEGAFTPQFTTVPTVPCCPLVLRLSVSCHWPFRTQLFTQLCYLYGPWVMWVETSAVKAEGPMDSHPSLAMSLLCKLRGLLWKLGTTVPILWVRRIKWDATCNVFSIAERAPQEWLVWFGLAALPIPMRSPCVCSQCYQTGLMSRYVESLRAGDTAFWRGPFGNFFYKPNQVSASTLDLQETPLPSSLSPPHPSLASRTAASSLGFLRLTVPFFLSPNPSPRVSLGLDMGGDGIGPKK